MNNYVMEKTSKTLTIFGLVLEGFAALSSLIAGIVLVNIDRFPFVEEVYVTIPADEEWIFELMTGVIGVVILIIGIVLGIMFTINFILFTKLMKGDYSKETAKKIYKYQIVWGIISLLMNTLTGILYLISGFQGIEGLKNKPEVSERD